MAKLNVRSEKSESRRIAAARLFRRVFPIAIFVLLTFYFSLPVSHALALETGLEFGTATGLSTQDIRVTIAKIIRAALGLLGIVAVGITLSGGFLWMTAGGNDDKIVAAKKWLTNGAIGLVIILLSFSITQFVLSRLLGAGAGDGTVTTVGGFGDDVFLSGALGAGPIESHFPARGAGDVPRNTRIFITFRDPIDVVSIANDTNENGTIGTTGEDPRAFDNYQDLARPESIQVIPIGQNVDPLKLTPAARTADAVAFNAEAAKLTPVGFSVAADGRTIVLTPVAVGDDGRVRTAAAGFAERVFLGNANASTAYLVRVTSAVKRAGGAELFAGAFREGYTWDFTVSTTIDLTPPAITSVIPFPDTARDDADGTVRGAPDQPRNVIVQVNFSEAVDPTVTSGEFVSGDATRSFAHLAVSTDGTAAGRIGGTFRIGNGYRTVEFTTRDACGQNSCGGTVYCLPGNTLLTAWADAARLEAGGPAGIPFSGVMDAAGNSLDGNGNGRAEGPGAQRFRIGAAAAVNAGSADSADWTFATSDALDLVAPEVAEITHYDRRDASVRFTTGSTRFAPGPAQPNAENISTTKPIDVLFTKLMGSGIGAGIGLSEAAGCNPGTGAGCFWHITESVNVDTDGNRTPDRTRAIVAHSPFRASQQGFDVPQYRVRLDSSIRDLYQNCLFTVGDPAGPVGPQGGERCVGSAGSEQCEAIP